MGIRKTRLEINSVRISGAKFQLNRRGKIKMRVHKEEKVFEQIASKYDTAQRIALAQLVAKRVREEMQGSPQSLIDYGSGTGLVSLELADLAESVLLVDSSRQMLEVAAAKISRSGISNN